MIFRDNSEEVPLNVLIWCVPKHNRHPAETAKLTVVFITSLDPGQRRMTGGAPASDFLYGDPITFPTVEIP